MEADVEMLRSVFRLPNVLVGSGNISLDILIRNVKAMQQRGKEKLLVLADFDYSLSRYTVNGCRGSNSFDVVDRSPLMSEQYGRVGAAIASKYSSLSQDPSLTKEEREKVIQTWYSERKQLTIETRVKKGDLIKIVADGNMILRDGCDHLVKVLEANAVPLVIISGGIFDTIQIAMDIQASITDNMIIISNQLIFDDNEVVTGFLDPMITITNKGELHSQFAALSKELKGRTNVILIGDSVDDPKMDNSLVERLDIIIKIGFLNHDVEELLPAYQDRYDVLITGDGDLTFINELIHYILTD